MNRARRTWLSWWTEWVIRLTPNRPDEDDRQRRQARFTYRSTVSGWPLRMTEFLRDRLRSRWLRMKRG